MNSQTAPPAASATRGTPSPTPRPIGSADVFEELEEAGSDVAAADVVVDADTVEEASEDVEEAKDELVAEDEAVDEVVDTVGDTVCRLVPRNQHACSSPPPQKKGNSNGKRPT
ncbi:unnamed protein product [Discula destructiva]